MKNKIYSFLLTLCFMLSCAFIVSACQSNLPEEPIDTNVYVTKPTIANAEIKVVQEYYSLNENVAEDGRTYVPKSNNFYIKVCFNEGYKNGDLVIKLNNSELTMTDETSFLISESLNSDDYDKLIITTSGNVSLKTYNISFNFVEADENYIYNLQLSTGLSKDEVCETLYNKYKFKFNAKCRELLEIYEDRFYTGNEIKAILGTGKNIEVTYGDELEILYACNANSVYEQYIESPLVNNNIQSIKYTENGVLSTIIVNEQNMSGLQTIDISAYNTNSEFYATVEVGAYILKENSNNQIYVSKYTTPFIYCELNDGNNIAISYSLANQEGNKAYLTLLHYDKLKKYYDNIHISVNGVEYINSVNDNSETDYYFTVSEEGIIEINLIPLWKYGTADGINDNMKYWNIEINDIVAEMVNDGELVQVNFGEFVVTRSENQQGGIDYLLENGVLFVEDTFAYYCRYDDNNSLFYDNLVNSVYFYKNENNCYKLRLGVENEQQEFQILKVVDGVKEPQLIENITSTTDTDQIKVQIIKVENMLSATYYDIEFNISLLNEGEYFIFGQGFNA